MRYSDWLGTNFKMNSDGQLRHFNCTIPRQRKRARAGEREGEKERERGTSRERVRAREEKRTRTEKRVARRRRRERGERRTEDALCMGWRRGWLEDGRAQEMTDRAHTRIIIITLLDRDGGERRARSARLRRALKYYTYQRENN